MPAQGILRLLLTPLLLALAVLCAPAGAQSWGGWWNDYEPWILWGDEPWSQRRVQPLPTVVDRQLVDTLVVPTLVELVADADDQRLRAVAAWALAEVAGSDTRAAASAALLAALQDPEDVVRAQAARGLGVVYLPERGADLVELARDSDAGRRLVDNERLEDAVRQAAMVALGAARDPAHAPALMELFDDLDDKRHDMRSAVLRALGRCGGESEQVREFLEDRLGDHWLEETVRASAARALAELGRPDAVEELTKVFGKSNLDRLIQASVLLAVGELAAPDDRKLVKLLVKEAFDNDDAGARTRALMGATLLLARDDDPSGNKRNHETYLDELEDQLDSPRFRGDGPLHALAAGLYARAHGERGADVMELVLEGLDDIKAPTQRGAYALALALSPPPDTGALMLELFRDVKHPAVRASVSQALGMLRHEAARDDLREVLAEGGQYGGVIDGCGTGLMLLPDDEGEAVLSALIADDGNVETRTARIATLGRFRTEAAVRALHALLVDASRDHATREAACRALAAAATARLTPWYAPY